MDHELSTNGRYRGSTPKILVLILLVLVGLFGIFFTAYIFLNREENPDEIVKNQIIKKDKPEDLINKVAKLVEIPENEVPTITTIDDISKLASQPLFKNAKNGDRVLIFTKSGKAIIYRPETNKIIEFTNIDLTRK